MIHFRWLKPAPTNLGINRANWSIMRYGNVITRIFIISFFSLSLANCCGVLKRLLRPENNNLYSVSVVTDPPGARMVLVNLNISGTTIMSTAYSPNVVYYNPSPESGTFLLVSHPGFREEVINLQETTTRRVRIRMEPDRDITSENLEPGAFFMGFGSTGNMPDLSYVADEKSVADLINEALVPLEKAISAKKAVVSVVDMAYAEAERFTGKIHVSSTPPRAELLLDGRPMGTTPKEIIGIQAGGHRIALIKEGYEVWAKQFTIIEKQEKRIVVRMQPSSLSRQTNSKTPPVGTSGRIRGATFKNALPGP